MPFKSDKQKKFFSACMNDKFRKKAKCPPKSVIVKYLSHSKKKHLKHS